MNSFSGLHFTTLRSCGLGAGGRCPRHRVHRRAGHQHGHHGRPDRRPRERERAAGIGTHAALMKTSATPSARSRVSRTGLGRRGRISARTRSQGPSPSPAAALPATPPPMFGWPMERAGHVPTQKAKTLKGTLVDGCRAQPHRRALAGGGCRGRGRHRIQRARAEDSWSRRRRRSPGASPKAVGVPGGDSVAGVGASWPA